MIVILNKNNHIFKKEPNKIAYLFGALPYSEIYIYINRVQYCIRIHKKNSSQKMKQKPFN